MAYRNIFGEERIQVPLFETGSATLDAILTDWFFGGGLSNAGNIASAFVAGLASISLALSPVGISGAEAVGQPTISVGVNLTNAGNISGAEAIGQPGLSYSLATTGIAGVGAYGNPGVVQTVTASGIATAGACGSPALSLTVTPVGIGSGGAFGTASLAQTITATGITATDEYGQPIVTAVILITAQGIASGEAHGQSGVIAVLYPDALVTESELGSPTVTSSFYLSVQGTGSSEAFGTAGVTRDYILAKVVKNAAKQPVAGADVFLFNAYTKALVGQTTTDSSGQWAFHLADTYSNYFVVVFKGDFAGITRNTLVPL